jgi:signal transduction histidine kinase
VKIRLPGGIRTTLAVALLLIVGGALGVAYLMVVPSLERRLVDDRLEELQRDGVELAAAYSSRDFSQPFALDNFVATFALVYNARTVVYQVGGPQPLKLFLQADSGISGRSVADDSVALETARTTHVARGRVTRGGRPYAEVAVPLVTTGNVLLLSSSIEDQLATVRVVKRRLLYATGVALLITAILGSAAAAVHARRIRRLERAANRIAQGRFDQPVVDDGEDELGELAAAFERMRVQLAQLDTARKEFVANASHELRTPLFSLAGFLELMSDEDLDEETRSGFLVTTREQVERLTRLSADLLDLSRMDAGRLHVESEEVVLADVARALVEELQPIAEGAGHVLSSDTEPDAWALADEERVLQIGRALLANAIAHTPPGTEVVLRTGREGGTALLSVTDDGPGVPPEHAERIFDRFYRVEGPQASGSGLGLAIARELAERMGGTVELSTTDGKTSFTLALPAVASAAEVVPVSS